MNANELADELEKVIDVRHYASEVLRKEVIKTLRQQQADLNIAKECYDKLEKKNQYLENKKEYLEVVISQQQAEIEALKKKIISLEFLARKEK